LGLKVSKNYKNLPLVCLAAKPPLFTEASDLNKISISFEDAISGCGVFDPQNLPSKGLSELSPS